MRMVHGELDITTDYINPTYQSGEGTETEVAGTPVYSKRILARN
jgi:hypothetical protein